MILLFGDNNTYSLTILFYLSILYDSYPFFDELKEEILLNKNPIMQ